MINIENITININSSALNNFPDRAKQVIVRNELVDLLRIISKDQRFVGQTVVIPDDCGQYGFLEGEFNLPTLLYFLADMLE